jgi:hypothetical protein
MNDDDSLKKCCPHFQKNAGQTFSQKNVNIFEMFGPTFSKISNKPFSKIVGQTFFLEKYTNIYLEARRVDGGGAR